MQTAPTVKSGFTLIELLAVIVIAGICLSFAMLAFGDFGQDKRIKFSGHRMLNLLKLAQQQALLEPATLGLSVSEKQYRFYKYTGARWQLITTQRPFTSHHFPKGTKVHLLVKYAAPIGMPEIIINSGGEVTPFQLTLKNTQNKPLLLLENTHEGVLRLKDNL